MFHHISVEYTVCVYADSVKSDLYDGYLTSGNVVRLTKGNKNIDLTVKKIKTHSIDEDFESLENSSKPYDIQYWQWNRDYTNDSGTCEVDFLVDNGYTVIPLEAEAVPNLRSKSMKIYSERFVPDITVRTSLSDYKREQFFVNIPLYCIENLTKEIKNKSDYLSDWEHFFVF